MDSEKKLWAGFIAAIILIISFNAVLSFYQPFSVSVNSKTEVFPEQIMGMKKTELISGDEAKKSVNGLHGLEIELKSAYIGKYQGEKGSNAIVWVSESYNTRDAKKLFSIMDQKMPTNKFFTGYQKLNYNGLELRYVYWPKQNMHDFYYLIGKKNYWIAVSVDVNMKDFLDEVLKKF